MDFSNVVPAVMLIAGVIGVVFTAAIVRIIIQTLRK